MVPLDEECDASAPEGASLCPKLERQVSMDAELHVRRRLSDVGANQSSVDPHFQ